MSAGTEYANRLEQWFSSCPGPVQDVLRPVFDPANDLLKAVAGDPDDLLRAGQRYVDVSREIVAVAEQQRTDRGALAGSWEGEGYAAFDARARDLEQKLEGIAEATGSTQEVLEAAARACVEGANLIIDVIVMLIAFAVSTFIIKAALAVFTLGASMAAWVAEQIAAGAAALGRIAQIVSRVAALLQRVAHVFRRLAEVLRRLADIFRELRALLQTLDKAVKATKALSGAGLAARGARGAAYGLVNNALLGGNVPRPLGSVTDAVQDVRSAGETVQDVEEAAGR
jgi:uncharacterized protein YukE